MTGPGPQPVAEVVSVFSQTITLTDEQIKALPTTPIEIVPAPGVGKALMPVVALLTTKFSGGGYEAIDGTARILIGWPGGYTAFADFLNSPAFAITMANSLLNHEEPEQIWRCVPYQDIAVEAGLTGIFLPSSQETANNANRAFTIQAFNSIDFEGGHATNTLEVTVIYTIIDV